MNIQKTIEIFIKLSSIQRFSSIKLAKNENVLEHLGFVTLLSYFIGMSLIEEGYELEIGSLLSKAILHDIEEAITGDIQNPFKYNNPELTRKIKEVESESINILIEEAGLPNITINTWNKAKIDIDGSIVSFCDLFSVVYKLHDEVIHRGNKTALIIIGKNIHVKAKEVSNKLINNFPSSTIAYEMTQYMFEILNQVQKDDN